MARDAIWQYASEEQLQDAQMAIERSVMNRIFKLAFYPNQDGDSLRDQWVAHILCQLLLLHHSLWEVGLVTYLTTLYDIDNLG